MNDQPKAHPFPPAATGRRPSVTYGTYRPPDPATGAAKGAQLLAMEVSGLAGAAPNPLIVVRLIVLLVRAGRLLWRSRRGEPG